MKKQDEVHPFNNEVEYGLRTLIILLHSFPKQFDLSELVYLDYLLVHSGDIDESLKSLHAPIPFRKEEVFIRRYLLESGLKYFTFMGLIDVSYKSSGIYYRASEAAEPFVDSLIEEYTTLLKKRAAWIVQEFGELNIEQIKSIIKKSSETTDHEIAFQINMVKE